MADTDDQNGARAVILNGDDIPTKDSDAPSLPATSPKPVTIESMARYLRSLTESPPGSTGNAFPIKDTVNVVKTHDDQGRPVPIVTPSSDAANVFATMEEFSVIQHMLNDDPDWMDLVKKIHEPGADVHKILRSIVGNTSYEKGDSAVITPAEPPETLGMQKKISAVLRKNRFNPEPNKTPFLAAPASASEIDSRPIGKMQTSVGKYDNGPVSETTGVTYEQMKKIGLALMLRATGEFADGDPTDIGVGTAALVPGTAQLTASRVINRRSMWASDLSPEQGRPNGANAKSFSLDLTLDNGQKSYGNLNNFLEPFGGFAPLGMIALGAALVVALKLLVEGIIAIPTLFNAPGLGSTDSQAKRNRGNGPFPHGSYLEIQEQGLISLADIGIPTLKHDYFAAVNRGIDVFFQFDGTDFIRVIKSPGYYAILVRSIVRSAGELISALEDVFSNPNPIGAIQALIGILDVIKSSKLIAFANMVATLGSIVLDLEDKGVIPADDPEGSGQLPDRGKISMVDRLPDNAATRQMKNRSNDGLKLAWRTSATPSMFLLPLSTRTANTFMPGTEHVDVTETGLLQSSRVEDADFSGRISGEAVKEIEDQLDSEYVPFYFHDIRTNEIVSFHAFLSAVTDSFTANYEKGKYYGRVDPVMIYGDTERAINITFNVVATNNEDFDMMWWKINKLITMLYPQWSKGRQLSADGGDKKFIQPFSQIPTSSPLIRLRLGDLFKTNYSKFALARLFGLGSQEFDFKDLKALQTYRENTKKNLQDVRTQLHKMRHRQSVEPKTADDPNAGYFADEGALLLPAPADGYHPSSAKSPLPSNPLEGREPIVPLQNSTNRKVKIVGSVDLSNPKLAYYDVELVEPKEGEPKGIFRVPFSSLTPDNEAINDRIRRAKGEASQQESFVKSSEEKIIDDFFSAEKNAIVRSFESTRGRGLAGFITSLSFDWKSPTWETAVFGSRAPQFCAITMAFTPIHDITPGIDSDGFNRAPVYNVGNLVNNIGRDPYGDGLSNKLFDENHQKITDKKGGGGSKGPLGGLPSI